MMSHAVRRREYVPVGYNGAPALADPAASAVKVSVGGHPGPVALGVVVFGAGIGLAAYAWEKAIFRLDKITL
jgi:hypothetical protein